MDGLTTKHSTGRSSHLATLVFAPSFAVHLTVPFYLRLEYRHTPLLRDLELLLHLSPSYNILFCGVIRWQRVEE